MCNCLRVCWESGWQVWITGHSMIMKLFYLSRCQCQEHTQRFPVYCILQGLCYLQPTVFPVKEPGKQEANVTVWLTKGIDLFFFCGGGGVVVELGFQSMTWDSLLHMKRADQTKLLAVIISIISKLFWKGVAAFVLLCPPTYVPMVFFFTVKEVKWLHSVLLMVMHWNEPSKKCAFNTTSKHTT